MPQVVFCQNPWALVPAARRWADAPKAWLQRAAYRHTMRRASAMVFISRYLQDAYRINAGRREARGVVMHYAAEDATRDRAREWRSRQRDAGRILCVSTMARHKNVETLVRAFELLLRKGHPGASLHLVGSWPDPRYERQIRWRASEAGLLDRIRFVGFVSREELDRLYAESRVFCLLSRCESFGIPAVEAQLFGTPVVCSNVCAVPEICGDGGLFFHPDDAGGVADALHRLLTDDGAWRDVSARALRNAAQYRWTECSEPLRELFTGLATAGGGERLGDRDEH
jgi:glycosyltransferase involved in cell wall biosynthesis